MMDAGSSAVSVETGLMTFAEFEKLPDPPAGHLELHDGRVVQMPPRKKVHMQIQQALFDLLAPLLRGHGFLTNEFAFRPAPEYEARQCDIGFVAQHRWDADDHEYFLGAPDLIVEVLSKSNTMDDILDRQDMCLRNGCVSFWVVDSRRKTIMVTTPDGITRTYRCGEAVSVPSPWLGTVEVAGIFPPKNL